MAKDRHAALTELLNFFRLVDADDHMVPDEFEMHLVVAAIRMTDGKVQADEALHRLAGSLSQVAVGAQEYFERLEAERLAADNKPPRDIPPRRGRGIP